MAALAVGIIAWGVGTSAPDPVATIAPLETQYGEAAIGSLTESTRVSATAASGEVISFTVPESPRSVAEAETPDPAAGAVPATQATTVDATTVDATAVDATTVDATAVDATTVDATAAPVVNTTPESTVTNVTAADATADGTTATEAATSTESGTDTTATDPAATAATTTGQDNTRVITSMAAIGTQLNPGDTAFVVDDRSTVVLSGSVPAWRDIDVDTTPGVDVQQLEAFLSTAGLDSSSDISVDTEVDSSTIDAIEEWQESMGTEPTGRVELGEVAFITGPVTVVAHSVEVGDVVRANDSVLDVLSGDPFVDVSTDESWIAIGDKVEVDLGRTNVDGTVTAFSSGIARISLPADTNVTDGADVAVNLSRVSVTDELLVPSSAVLQTDLAGPTVTVREPHGTQVVTVEVLASSGTNVAVKPLDDGLAAGDEVVRF